MGEQTVKKHKFKKWRKPGIRMQVMLGFVLFTAVIVTLLWTFQITLLNTFYKAIKVNEVRSVANRVVAMLDESASASDYFEVTRSTNISILISNSDGSNVSFSPAARGGVLERFDYLDCKQLFTEVKAAGGSVMDDNITDPTSTIERQDRTIIYAQTVTLSSGNEYLVLLSCDVIPVDSTGRLYITDCTYAVHWYAKSWMNRRTVLRSKLTRPLHRLLADHPRIKEKVKGGV